MNRRDLWARPIFHPLLLLLSIMVWVLKDHREWICLMSFSAQMKSSRLEMWTPEDGYTVIYCSKLKISALDPLITSFSQALMFFSSEIKFRIVFRLKRFTFSASELSNLCQYLAYLKSLSIVSPEDIKSLRDTFSSNLSSSSYFLGWRLPVLRACNMLKSSETLASISISILNLLSRVAISNALSISLTSS